MSEPDPIRTKLSDTESWNNASLREQLAFLMDFEGSQADEIVSAWHWYNRGWEAHKIFVLLAHIDGEECPLCGEARS